MKTLLLFCLFSSAMAYEYIPEQKLPTTLTYSCDDPLLEDSFLRMFAIWNFACDGIFMVTKVDSNPTIKISYGILTIFEGGRTLPFGTTADIKINYLLFADFIMLHEIGHCLGLDHTDVPYSIMHPLVKREATLVQDDVDGVRELYDLSPKRFDFILDVKGKGFKATCPYGKADWSTLNFTLIKGKKAIRERRGGQVEMIYKGISVYKTVNVK